MAHFALLWKARTIEKYRQNYENEKINSIIMSSSDVPDKTLFQRWRHYKHGMQKRLSRKFSKWYPEGSTVSNFFVGLKADRKLPSILFRSLSGFIGGLLLTYLGFMFFVFQLSLSLMYATVLCSILGVLLTLGLTFSNRTRCLIFLLVPQLFSRVGRYTLTCYALVLILTGPATNTLKNSEVLSESMACTQEQIKLDVKQIDESIKKPYNTIKDSLKVTVKRMNLVVKKLKIALIKINKLILSIASTIQSGYSWLRDMADSCNNDLGNPYDKCSHIIKEYYEKSNQNYDSNDMSKHVKHNRQFIKDILYAIGVKNLKRRQGYSDGKDFKRNTDADMDNNVELKHYKEKKENIDNTQSPNTEDKGDGNTISSTYKADDLSFSDINNTAQKACKSFKSYEKFCVPADFTSDTFFATIRTSLKKFVHCFSTLIHLKLNVQHTYTFIGNSSSSNQIAAGIVTEVRNRADPLLTWLSWSSCVTSLFLLLIIFRAKHYQHMFETRSRFDNRFITKEFRELDLKRLREGRETVLPLNTRERAKYVTTTSFRLVASEKLHLNRSAVFMTVATFKLLIHIVADYSLFWVLTTIRHYGKLPSPLKPPSVENGTTISGSGFVARFLQALIDTMNAQLTFPPHNRSCLPDPYPPDIKRYCQIGFLIFLLWFFALFEPYGLRLRHLIMGRYRPQRAKDRAAWLYNHILRTRARFMKFARRKLHREYKYSSHAKYTLRQCFKNHVLLQWLTSLFGIKLDGPRCLLCNLAEDTSNVNTEIVKCEVPNCPGSYCLPCFSDIGQLCTICLSPSDYGDFSDVSFEKDTSDENENTDDEHTTDDDYDPGDGPSGSYKRKSNSEYYALEDGDSEDDTFSRRSLFSEERRKRLLFGRENTDSDTIPLLQRQGNGFNENHKTSTSQSYFYEQIITKFAVINCDKIRLYPKTVKVTNKKQTQSNYVISNYFQNINVLENNSSIGIVQFSLYEITSRPLNVKKSEYTTKFAKYLRKKKLIRQKRSIYSYSPYFMTFNNNSNNVNNETTKDKRKKRMHKKDSKKTKKDGTNNNLDNEFKSFHNNHDLKNERKSKRRSKKNSDIKSPFSKFWKSVTCNVLQIKSTNDTKTSPPIGENHAKRKKKRKKTKKLAKKSTKSMLNIKKGLAENSRLFAFLYGRDWINNCYDDNKNFLAADEEIAINNHVIANKKIIVNDVVIPKLNLSVSVESIKDPMMQKINQCMSKKKISNHAFEKFVKSIGCFSHQSIGSIGSNKEINNDNLDLDEFDAADDICQDVQNHEQKINGGSKSSELQGSSRDQNSPADFNIGASPKRNVSPEEVRSQNSSISTSLSNLKHRCSALLFRKDKKKSLNETAITERLEATQLNVDPVHKKIVQYNANNQKRIGLSLRCGRFVEDIFHNAAFDKRGNKGIQTTPEGIQTDDKETTVLPLMNTFGCQNLILNDTQEFGAQVRIRKCHRRKTFKNARISTSLSTCTCATQYHDTVHKDTGTSMTPVLQNKQIQKTITSPTTTETTISGDYGSHSDTTVCSYEKMYNKAIYQLEKLTNRVGKNDQEVKYRYDNCTSFSKKFGKFRLRVVTKTNRSTLTDRTTQRDASTAMYDWWSPIVERKEVVTKRPVEKRRKDTGQPRLRERRSYRSKGMSTGEKIVAFRSKTQFIPSIDYSCSDVMSPSRYILESQRYYNEVFSNVFPSPRVYPVPCLQKNNNLDRDRSKLSNAQHRRRGRKTKRLDESYTPRKDLQSCLRRRF